MGDCIYCGKPLGFLLKSHTECMKLELKKTQKNMRNVADQMYDIADESALKGETVLTESLCKVTPKMPDEEKNKVEVLQQQLFDRFGPKIPANTAHRISWEMSGWGKIWSDNPGCFERHLERRDGSLLFPPERRIVLRKEIQDAIEKDRIEAQLFTIKYNAFVNTQLVLMKNNHNIKLSIAQELLKEIMSLIEESATIGESVAEQRNELEIVEEMLINSMNEVFPDGAVFLKKILALSSSIRASYRAQYVRDDSPILKEEFIPTLLSEDLMYISGAAIRCKRFGFDDLPENKERHNRLEMPSSADIKLILNNAIKEGFSKKRAGRIMEAWNEGLAY
jgi:hypothetical protein